MSDTYPAHTTFETYIAKIVDRPLLRLLLAVIDSGVNAPSLDNYTAVLLARTFLRDRVL